jgi:hypothetical protein
MIPLQPFQNSLSSHFDSSWIPDLSAGSGFSTYQTPEFVQHALVWSLLFLTSLRFGSDGSFADFAKVKVTREKQE